MTPFQVELGCKRKSPVDFRSGSDSTTESEDEFLHRMAAALMDAIFATTW